ncbi:MAG: 23S rRNA (adenine(2503)-C(2))-methyltransferase RlmN [Thermoanaerobaculia bacterium]
MKEKARTNLHDLSDAALASELTPRVSPSFRIPQIETWLHDRGVDSFDAMTNVPKDLRERLAQTYRVRLPELVQRTEPAADGSRKYLFRVSDRTLVEAVYMPMGSRTTLCLSSQAGCAVGCTFCVTGFFGAGRNLPPSEILGQLHRIRAEEEIPWEALNVVFMGMGEPLLNMDHLTTTLEVLYEHVSPRRITVSTSGIIPGIRQLATLERRPNLAVSINAPDQKRRVEIMPITAKYPLRELIGALRDFPLEKGRKLTAEYVLLEDWNDAPADAERLARLLRDLHVKVNLIPFNPDPNLPAWMKRPSDPVIDRFAAELAKQRVSVTVRRSRGDQIAAACGQLRGRSEPTRAAARRTSVR